MKRALRRTNAAEADLDEIFLHIAAENLGAAERVIHRIEAAEERLGEFPELGRLRDDLSADARSWPVGDFLIIYELLPDAIVVIRILHGARDLGGLFSGD